MAWSPPEVVADWEPPEVSSDWSPPEVAEEDTQNLGDVLLRSPVIPSFVNPNDPLEKLGIENPPLREILTAPISLAGDVARGTAADVAAGMSALGGDVNQAAKSSGNILAALKGEPLPIDTTLAGISKEAPVASTVGKISQGVAGSLPLIAVMPQGALGKLVAAGFTADMLHNAGPEATALGEEMGKPTDQRDYDKITSAISGLVQTAAFAPLAGSHATGKLIGERVAPKAEAIRALAKQLQADPQRGSFPVAPAGQRQLGVRVSPEEFLQPGVPELASAALDEAQGRTILAPGEQPAIEALRNAINPPRIEQAGRVPRILDRQAGETVVQPTLEGVKVQPGFERTASDLLQERDKTGALIEKPKSQQGGQNAVQPESPQFLRPVPEPSREGPVEVPGEGNRPTPDVGGDKENATEKKALTQKEELDARGYSGLTQDKMTSEQKAEAVSNPIPTPEQDAVRFWELQDELLGEKDMAKKMKLYQDNGVELELIKNRNPKSKGNPPERPEPTNQATLEREVSNDQVRQTNPEAGAQAGGPTPNQREGAGGLDRETQVRQGEVPGNGGGGAEELESFTPLEPQSGSPIKSEIQKFIERANTRLAELQNKLRRGFQGGQVALGIPTAVLDTALQVARLSLKATGSLAKATAAAIDWIRANHPQLKFDADKFREHLYRNVGEPPSVAKGTPTKAKGAPIGAKTISSIEKVPTLDDVKRIFEPEKKPGLGLKQRAINIAEAVRTGVSSKFRPINKLAEDIAKSYGLKSSKDIAGIMEQLKGSQGKGEADVWRFDRDVSNLVKGSEADFNSYMFLRRSIDRLEEDQRDIARAQAGEPVKTLNRRAVSSYTLNELRPLLSELESKLGPDKVAKFQKAAEGYQKYLNDALALQVESGRMSRDVYDAIKAGNQFYAPFKVMKYLEENSKPEGSGKKIDTVADYTKAMKGIEDPNFKLGDMLGAARQNILISRILADKNMAMRHVAELAPFDINGTFIKRLRTGQDPARGFEAVNVLEDGKRVRYQVDPKVAEAIQIYGGNAGGVISRYLSRASIPFRAGATALNLPFQVSNLLADQPRAALVSKYGITGFRNLVQYPMDFVHSLFASIGKDVLGVNSKLMFDFYDSGVAGTTVQEYLTPEALKFHEPTNISKSRKLAESVLFTIPRFAQAIEQTSKVIGVKRAMRAERVASGKELAKRVPEAITELRRFSGSPDFGRQGKVVEQARLNLLYMFLNARIQGAVSDVGRLMGRDGAKTAASTWIKVGTAVGIPTAYLYYLNHLPQYQNDYDQRSKQEKQNYWLIPKDTYITDFSGNQQRDYWRIPKREVSKWFANLTESALDFAHERNPQAAGDFGKLMMQEISPVNIQGDTAQERLESVASSLNPLLKAPLELASGRDLYRHRSVVPESMKNASPEEQYTPGTAEAFRKLAALVPGVAPEFLRSPIMLENLTRNLTAGLITQFLPHKAVPGRKGFENWALMSRFQASPYTDDPKMQEELKQLQRESADESLRRHRAAVKLMDENAGKSLAEIAQKAPQDEKLIRHIIDLYIAKQNGITPQERQVLALPARQRASYVARRLKGLNPAQQQQVILDLARKRILTETVMSQLPEATNEP